jgi:hypothetical protein
MSLGSELSDDVRISIRSVSSPGTDRSDRSFSLASIRTGLNSSLER